MSMAQYLVALNRSETLWASKDAEASSSQCLFVREDAERIADKMRNDFPNTHIVDLMPWYSFDKKGFGLYG